MENLKNKLFSINSLWWIALFLTAVFIHFKYYLNSDEGIILEGAWNLINGKRLFIDFVEFVPPANFYIIYWAWKIFGVHYWVARFIAIIFVYLGAIGVYKISRFIYKPYAKVIPLIFILSTIFWPIINHNVFNIVLCVWAAYFFLKGLKDNKHKYFILSGLLTSISMLFLQSRGLVLLLCLASYLFFLLLKEKNLKILKNLAYYCLFSIAPLTISLLWPLDLQYEYLFKILLNGYTDYNKFSQAYLILAIILIFFSIYWLRRNFNKYVVFLLYLQFSILALSGIQRPDVFHLAIAFFPILAISNLVLTKANNSPKLIGKYAFYIIFGLSLLEFYILPFLIYLVYEPSFYFASASEEIITIEKECQTIYAGPFMPMRYFALRKVNPTPYYITIINSYDLNFNSDQNLMKKFVEDAAIILEKNPPACAVMDYEMVNKLGHDRNNSIDNFIKNNYDLIYSNWNLLLYKHKENK